MSTGAAKTSNGLAKGLRFENGALVVLFRDGREMHVPLRLYPTLLEATPSLRSKWVMIGPGKAFHWPGLDLDLSVEGLIRGMRESMPRPPRVKAKRMA